MSFWADTYKIFKYALERTPIETTNDPAQIVGVGVTQPEAVPNLRQDGAFANTGTSYLSLRDNNDYLDLNTVTSRIARYKEYERLRNVAEIETVMTIIADEACVSGNTPISTPFYGTKPLKWFAENKKEESFLVYCYDFQINDYTLGWAYDPRYVKTADTLKIVLDNGTHYVATPDHRVLLRSGEWIETGKLKFGDKLMPFHNVPANTYLNKCKKFQFPRIFTFSKGWMHERQFIDEWKSGKENEKYKKLNIILKTLAAGLTIPQMEAMTGEFFPNILLYLKKEGFSYKELKNLGKRASVERGNDYRRVIGVRPWKEIDVYDLSVDKHKNFCTDAVVLHNCQKGENGNVGAVTVKDEAIKKECEKILFHRKYWNLNKNAWNYIKNSCIWGDLFLENIINTENPEKGILRLAELPADSIFRIETIKGKLVEFQQSKEGPDYQHMIKFPITQATDAELMQANTIRFSPDQITHVRQGDCRKTFYPYGVSLIEAARSPAHQMRLMEDSMLVYRLCLAGKTRVKTEHSWKYIKDLTLNDKVWSYNNNGKLELTNVISIENNGIQKVYKVKSKHLDIIGNESHPILVNRNSVIQYVAIKDLIVKSDKLINYKQESNNVKTKIPRIFIQKWARLTKNQINQFLCCKYENKSQLMRELEQESSIKFNRIKQFLYTEGKALSYDVACKICEKFNLDKNDLIISDKGEINSERINVPEYIDSDFARLFGFLVGDGTVTKHSVCFTTSPHKDLNEKYSELLNKYFGEVHFELDKRSKIGIGKFTASSTQAAKIMKSLGFKSGPQNKRIPQWVFNSSNEIKKSFIQGLADADSHIRILNSGLPTAEFSMCNRQLIEDIKEIWHSIGLSSGHIRSRKTASHEIEKGRYIKETNSWELYISEKELETYEKIESVEYVGEKEVYDISVNNNLHNFIANCMPVHNSRAAERRIFYVDIGQIPSHKGEALVERMQDQFRKKKVASKSASGASAVDERWHPPSVDEDIWVAVRPNSNTRVETLPGACLALNTLIPLLDGRVLTLNEIINEFNDGKQLWAYSCNPKNGKPAPGKITWAGITRKNTQVVKLTFDNGKSITCTPDHNFPVIGKGKVQAQNLKIGESMIAFNYKGIRHARKEALQYNHKLISIEWLDESQDTGTLTIDGMEELHNYHTFAVCFENDITPCGIYTYNSNLGEIDDALYFRNKLYIALNFPNNYFSSEDPNVTRITLSARDIKFARMIERIQSNFEEGIQESLERHLRLCGYPEEKFEDLKFKMTPPSDWKELSRAEVINNRINNAIQIKGSGMYSDFDVMTTYLQLDEKKAREIIARNQIQQLYQVKLQIVATNPGLLGVGAPGSDETEIGAEFGGPNPTLSPDQQQTPQLPAPNNQDQNLGTDLEQPEQSQNNNQEAPKHSGLSEPEAEDIKKYDLEIQNYASEMDIEDIDYST